AIAASSEVLAIRGKVLPATLSDVALWAELDDGRRIEGESQITAANGRIIEIGCTPVAPPALPSVLVAIQEADLIVLGPGSLYTSVAPNLLVPDIVDAIANRHVPRIYVCNIMSQPGETDGYTVADHVKALDAICRRRVFDAVLVQKRQPSALALARYAKEDAHPIIVDQRELVNLGCRVILANVMDEDPNTQYVRHSSQRLARVILRWYERVQSLELEQHSRK
ncbi:MAG: gluconeogenesis factor YvcK family protein, partial [Thermosynechococcaceae cyanobacterium]